ncbi:MAG: hypothetical protein VX265_07325 [Myxococcota bacterium]|nr:hypothetical protein [Myxococcota bacterium]
MRRAPLAAVLFSACTGTSEPAQINTGDADGGADTDPGDGTPGTGVGSGGTGGTGGTGGGGGGGTGATGGTGGTGSDPGDGEVLPVLPPCPTVGGIGSWGEVANADIREASGLVHSATNPGVLWTHNDAGNPESLFAFAEDGRHLGEWMVETTMRDWEDMDRAFDANLGAEALYIGDVGDNGRVRSEYGVVIVAEPLVDATAAEPLTGMLTPAATVTLTYPEDRSYDSESVAVDPLTGDLILIVKSGDGLSSVYRKAAPHADGERVELEWIGSLTFGADPLPGSPRTTAAAFSPDGGWFAVRTYTHAYLWRRPNAISVGLMLTGEPCDLIAPAEDQGEAIAFRADGSGYITVSEGLHPSILTKDLTP